ncbi:MAG TPA: permease-like cell division protein FtsX [Chitinophagaceae bacterium]|nr:permease-like cell division protein FtsX [Chitinophagaceae bacterium]
MSILGVTLVLLVLGVFGGLIIIAGKVGSYFKENVEVKVVLRGDLNPKDSTALMQYITDQPYTKSMEYITREAARKIFLGDGNEDWNKVLDYNPLPNVINFKVKKEYLKSDILTAIKTDLEKQTYVTEVTYQKALVTRLNSNIRKWSFILIAIAVILGIVVIILIDNTIKLAMFSNRFLIKTMQMVGATRWFIAKPMNIKAIINGAVSGGIASVSVWLLLAFFEGQTPELKAIRDNSAFLLLFLGLIVIGVGITLFSTNRSVAKYLRMKLDDLY